VITIFNRIEIFSTYSMTEQAKIRAILSQHSINYYIRIINTMSSSLFGGIGNRARTGSFGQNMDLNYQYIIYVHKRDYDIAKHVINK